ncbi:MAG: tetratricopeptide repeat protein [Marinifilaceae bacterium]|jgi:tetratricopeptide (TPR) repeat protein|nr:tetratricopeptide repeat protein [Marinifilaceae bacterium]
MNNTATENNQLFQYILDDSKIGERRFEFNFMSKEDARALVDFIGGIVKPHLDINEYIAKAKELTNEYQVSGFNTEYFDEIKEKIETEIINSEDEQYKNICTKLFNLRIEQFKLWQTDFSLANESEVLREFYFFISMISSYELEVEIYNAGTADLTEIFWLFRSVPKVKWYDMTPTYPDSPLPFFRDAIYSDGYDSFRELSKRLVFINYPKELKEICDEACFNEFLGQRRDAIEAYKSVFEKHNDWATLYRIGECFSKMTNYIMARKYYKLAYEKNPNSAILYCIEETYDPDDSKEELFEYYKTICNENPNGMLLDKIAEYHYEEGEYLKAEEYTDKAINEACITDRARMRMYFIAEDLFSYEQEYKKAADIYLKSIELNMGINRFEAEDSLYQFGLCQYYLNDFEKAIDTFNTGIETYPETIKFYHSKAYTLLQFKENDKAIEIYNTILEIEPCHENYYQKGLLCHNHGDKLDAIEAYTMAIKKVEDEYEDELKAKYLRSRSSSYNALGEIDKTLEDLEVSIKLNPTEPSICLDFIELHIQSNNFSGIINDFDQYENIVNEKGSQSQQLLFLYLKSLICIAENVSIEYMMPDMYRRSQRGFKHQWNFRYTDKWIEKYKFNKEQKELALKITKWVKGE